MKVYVTERVKFLVKGGAYFRIRVGTLRVMVALLGLGFCPLKNFSFLFVCCCFDFKRKSQIYLR